MHQFSSVKTRAFTGAASLDRSRTGADREPNGSRTGAGREPNGNELQGYLEKRKAWCFLDGACDPTVKNGDFGVYARWGGAGFYS